MFLALSVPEWDSCVAGPGDISPTAECPVVTHVVIPRVTKGWLEELIN